MDRVATVQSLSFCLSLRLSCGRAARLFPAARSLALADCPPSQQIYAPTRVCCAVWLLDHRFGVTTAVYRNIFLRVCRSVWFSGRWYSSVGVASVSPSFLCESVSSLPGASAVYPSVTSYTPVCAPHVFVRFVSLSDLERPETFRRHRSVFPGHCLVFASGPHTRPSVPHRNFTGKLWWKECLLAAPPPSLCPSIP